MKGSSLPVTSRERCNFVLSGDHIYWRLQKVHKRRLWKRAFLCMGEPAGRLTYWGLWEMDEEGLWKWSTSMRALWGEPGRRDPLLGSLKDTLRKALETGVFLQSGPVWELCRVCSFGREFERNERFYQETFFYWGIREICKRRLWKQATLFIGAPMGNLEIGGGACLPGTLTDSNIWAPFSWTQTMLGV